MIIPPAVFAAFMQAVESHVHEEGWDRPPLILAAMGEFAGDLGTHTAYGLAPMALPFPIGYQGNPVRDLHYLAFNFGYATLDELPQAVFGLLDENFGGVVFSAEGYVISATDEERAAIGNTPIADVPGARENRVLHGVDTSGRRYVLERVRGEKPKPVAWCTFDGKMEAGEDDITHIHGTVVSALTILTRGMCRLIAPSAHEMPALPAWDRTGPLNLLKVFEAYTGCPHPCGGPS